MKIFSGSVVSKKMQKTATVEVVRIATHPRYKRRLKRAKKYQVHDELGADVGDRVKFIAIRPVSKTKKWRIVEIVNPKVKKQEKSKHPRSEKPRKRK